MTRNKKSKRSGRKSTTNQKLASMFKLSRAQLATRKTTGGGLHRTYKDVPRSVQNRRAIDDQLDK